MSQTARLTQVSKRTGTIDRVPQGETPVLELYLDPDQHVVSVELKPHALFHSDRKTVDWDWTVYVVTPL